jgi:hypothetical protein
VNTRRRSDVPGWTQVDELVAILRRRWDTGLYLKAYLGGELWQAVELPVKGPSADEMVAHLDRVRRWLSRFEEQASEFAVEYEIVQSRQLDATRIPARVRIESFDQVCRLLSSEADVETIEELRTRTRAVLPALAPWVSAHPMVVLRNAQVWGQILETVDWMVGHDTSRLYVRQIDVPGVDTRFVERHHRLLEQLLTVVLPAYRFNPEGIGFSARFRFREKPVYVRFRVLSSDVNGSEFSEMTVRSDELARSRPQAMTIFVVEDEVTYLAFPPVPNTLVVFGSGFALTGAAALPWLGEKELVYWGDIDTHGFDILNRLRTRHPSVQSILMCRQTLLAHPGQWVTELSPTSRPLPHLTREEASLYEDLVLGTYGDAVRLEQERIRFSMVEDALRRWR